MDQTGHRSVGIVRRYVRNGSLFRESAVTAFGTPKLSAFPAGLSQLLLEIIEDNLIDPNLACHARGESNVGSDVRVADHRTDDFQTTS